MVLSLSSQTQVLTEQYLPTQPILGLGYFLTSFAVGTRDSTHGPAHLRKPS